MAVEVEVDEVRLGSQLEVRLIEDEVVRETVTFECGADPQSIIYSLIDTGSILKQEDVDGTDKEKGSLFIEAGYVLYTKSF